MPTKKKAAKKTIKKATKPSPVKKKAVGQQRRPVRPNFPTSTPASTVLYIDAVNFVPGNSGAGYDSYGQEGRICLGAGQPLKAPIILPVGSTLSSVTLYYKNTSTESMPVAILKNHIDHHCPSGEVEVSLDALPPATVAPDNFAAKEITHFSDGGVILDEYLYFIEISNTTYTATEVRTFRGMRIEYV